MRSLFEELEFNNLVQLLDHGHEFTRDIGLVTLPQKPPPEQTLSVQLPLFSWK